MSFKYTLHYFDYRGRAELSRLVFAAAGVKFYDNRITDWPVTRCGIFRSYCKKRFLI